LPVAVIPPAAPPPPPVALSNSVIQAAGAYRLYMRRAAEISPAFADGPAVEQSLIAGVSYEPHQFLHGVIAYAALVALQSPQFVAGVRTYAVDPEGRRALAAKLLADPNYAQALPSADGAAALVSATLIADAARVRHAGELVKQAAYDVQHQNWSKGEVTDRDGRLAGAKTVSSQQIAPPSEDVALLTKAVNGSDASGLGQLGATGDGPHYTAVVSRALTLAALAALGEAGDDKDAALQPLFEEKTGDFCLNMAKLNVYQCLSVAKPYYEDVFCLGQHVLLDTAQCVSKVAGEPQPAYVPVSVPTPAAPAPTKAKAKAKSKAKAKAKTSQAD
jgi:cell division septation protein DedD